MRYPHATHGSPHVVLATLVALLLTGCAIVRPPGDERRLMIQPQFRAYTEHVFRLHNRVATEYIMELPDLDLDDPARAERVEALEASMLDACRSLNRMVEARTGRNGETPGPFALLFRFPDEVAECHAATLELEAALADSG